tara:strand:+ start:9962 stop:10654 length:693 start_codon:yes stop_codon:yes gene_type:complete
MRLAGWWFLLWVPLTHAYVEEIPGYEQFEATAIKNQLSPKYVYSMALAESGHWLNDEFIPHPYAISLGVDESVGQLKHEGFYPETKAQAEAMLSQLLKAGYRNIGVGMMQVNIKANPDIVDDYLSLLDPTVNLSSAAKVLKWCRRYELATDVFACYSHGSADSTAGQHYAARVISYASDFGDDWELKRHVKPTAIYTFEEFVSIASERYARSPVTTRPKAPVVISSYTTQ